MSSSEDDDSDDGDQVWETVEDLPPAGSGLSDGPSNQTVCSGTCFAGCSGTCSAGQTLALAEGAVEIPLAKPVAARRKRPSIKKHDRILRANTHAAHLLCLFCAASHANARLAQQHDLLAATILSQMPDACTNIPSHGKGCPAVASDQGKLLLDSIKLLAQQFLQQWNFHPSPPAEAETDLSTPFMERDSLISHQLGALGFTALLGSLGLDVRLVASLHPISLSFSTLKPSPKRKHSSASASSSSARKRRRKSTGEETLVSASRDTSDVDSGSQTPLYDEAFYPIKYWCEVLFHDEWYPLAPA